MKRPCSTDRDALSNWSSEFASALADATEEVARRFGADPEDMVDMLASIAADYPGVSRAVAAGTLLEHASTVIFLTLDGTYRQQDERRPVTTFADLDGMRRAADSFSAQASYLVQPRLAPARWPARTSSRIAVM